MKDTHLMPPLCLRLGVSTWSLHHRLTERRVSLLDLPAEAAAHGLGKLEVCHFHLPSTDTAYLDALRGALENANVELWTLLVDAGDLTAPDLQTRAQAEKFIAGWVDVAARLGATRVRAVAGEAAPSAETLAVSAAALRRLAGRAQDAGMHLSTENWHALLDFPADVLALLDSLDGQVGLKLDFGNWPRPRKYADLARIAARAECTHAKAFFSQTGEMDSDDFVRCLDICRGAGFDGPHILIYDSGGDEWACLNQMRDVVQAYV